LSTSLPNGHVAEFHSGAPSPPSVADRIEEHVRGLEELLIPLRAERDQLQAQLDALKTKERAIIHATAALRPAPRTPPSAPKAQAKAKAKGGWTPSEERLKSLFELILKESEPVSPTQLAEKSEGLGVETAGKGFKILRDRELIRVTARLRGGGALYAPMPNAEWPA
jgi:DNA-binding transcriptional ArsR family regulator